jgi:hypothetical protein
MSERDIIARLARACAHGHRQLEFVNELLAGEAYSKLTNLNFSLYGQQAQAILYGDTRMSSQSWISLKKRLVTNGFMIKMHPYDKDYRRDIELRFSV